MNNLIWLRVGVLSVACLLGCNDEPAGDETAEGEPCLPNESVACSCSGGGSGAQVCEPEGVFGPCICADGETGDSNSGDGDGDGDTADTDGDEWDGESTPSWSEHIAPLLQVSCGAGINGCHSREAYAAAVDSDCRGWLTLENVPLGSQFYSGPDLGGATGCPDMVLYDRLTTLAPWQCAADSKYVTPGSLEASYVWQKIQGTNLCELSPGVLSESMPPMDSGIELTAIQEDMIEAWILAGAPNDN